MSGLPLGWAMATVGDLVQRIEAGKNFRCIERPPEAGELGVVKVSAVSWGKFREAESKTVPADVEVDERARIVAGDLLISRANTIELVGATVRVEQVSRRLYLSDKVLRLNAPIDLRSWLHRYLSSPGARRLLAAASSGNQMSMRNISQAGMLQLPIPVAPAVEQERIADKLDAVLARVDACRDCLDRMPAILKRFRRSVLAAATSGRLTEEWREIHDQQEWQPSTLAGCGEVSGGLTMNAKRRSLGLARRYLRVANVYANRLELSDVAEIGLTVSEHAKTRLRAGDLLIVEGNGSLNQLGRVALWTGEIDDCVHQNHLIRWRTSGPLPKFVLFWLLSPRGRTDLMNMASTTTGLHTLSISKVGAAPIALPPACAISAATPLAPSAFRSATTTLAPASASPRA